MRLIIFYNKKAMTIQEILALEDFKKAVDVLTKDTRKERNREESKKVFEDCLLNSKLSLIPI